MNIREYFRQADTPSERSPVGELMVRVLAKNPGMDFAAARLESHSLLNQAAGRRIYQVPAACSPEEKATNRAKMVAAFAKVKSAA